MGINDYPGDDYDLRMAVPDARSVDAALDAYGVPPARRVVLVDGQATGANLRASLEWLVTHAAQDATAVFFFAGHVTRAAPSRSDRAGRVALVGADGVNVTEREVAAILARLEARSAWLAIAACYGAAFDGLLAPGRVLTAAAGPGELAYENTALGNSYLVEYMVQRAMLEGQAPGSVQEAFQWARAQIARDFPDRQPVIIDRSDRPIKLRHPRTDPRPAPPAVPRRDDIPAQGPDPEPEPAAPPPTPPAVPQPGCISITALAVCHSSARTDRPAA